MYFRLIVIYTYTVQTLPQLSTPDATPTKPGRISPGGSSLSNISSSSHLGLGDQDFSDYADKTWPRRLSRSKGDSSSTSSPDTNSRRNSRNLKTEGTPTFNESVGMELRGVVQALKSDGTPAPQTDPLHRRSPGMSLTDELEGVQEERKFGQYASQNIPGTSATSLGGVDCVPSLDNLNGNHHFNLTVGGGEKNHIDSAVDASLKSPGASAAIVPRISINQSSIDGGDEPGSNGGLVSSNTQIAQALKRMKVLGHRRAASVPVKKRSSHLSPSLPVPSGLLMTQLANSEEEHLGQLNNPLVRDSW